MIDRSVWTDPVFCKRHMLASERAKASPALLTDDDIVTLDAYDGGADLWRQRRDDAIMAAARVSPSWTTRDHRVKASSSTQARAGMAQPRKGEDWSAFVTRCSKDATSLNLFNELYTV